MPNEVRTSSRLHVLASKACTLVEVTGALALEQDNLSSAESLAIHANGQACSRLSTFFAKYIVQLSGAVGRCTWFSDEEGYSSMLHHE